MELIHNINRIFNAIISAITCRTLGNKCGGLSLLHPIYFTIGCKVKGERNEFQRALTCVREQRMVVGMIVEFRPHTKSELLHVWQICLVMDVL